MLTNKFKADPLIERCYCEDCKVEMQQTGEVKASNPPQYGYVCPKCEKQDTSTISYPRVVYLEYVVKK